MKKILPFALVSILFTTQFVQAKVVEAPVTFSPLPTISLTPSPTAIPTVMPTVLPTVAPTPTPTKIPTATPVPTVSATPSATPSASPTPKPFTCKLNVNANWVESPLLANRGWTFAFEVMSSEDPMAKAQFYTYHGPVGSEVGYQSNVMNVPNSNRFNYSTVNPVASGASSRWRFNALAYNAAGTMAYCETFLTLNDPPAPSRSCRVTIAQEGRGPSGIYWGKKFQQSIVLDSGTPANADRLVISYQDSQNYQYQENRNGPLNQYAADSLEFLKQGNIVAADGLRKEYAAKVTAQFFASGSGAPIATCSADFTVKNPDRELSCTFEVFQKRGNQELPDIFWGKPYGIRSTLMSRFGTVPQATRIHFSRYAVTACPNAPASWGGEVMNPANPYVHDNLESRNLPPGCGQPVDGRIPSYFYNLQADYYIGSSKVASCGPLRFEVKNPLPNEVMDLNVYVSPAEVRSLIQKMVAVVRANPQLQARIREFVKGQANVDENGGDNDLYADYVFVRDLVIQALNGQGPLIREIWGDDPYFNVNIHVPSDVLHSELSEVVFQMACSNPGQLVAQAYAKFPVRCLRPGGRICSRRVGRRMARISGIINQACVYRSGRAYGPIMSQVEAGVDRAIQQMASATNGQLKLFYDKIDLRNSALLSVEQSRQIIAQYAGSQTMAKISKTTGTRPVVHQFECSLLNKYGQCAIDSLASFIRSQRP